MTDFSSKVAAFACNTSGTRQNIVPTGGPGVNPKAAILVVSGATALDTSTAHMRMSVGMTDGTTQLVDALMYEDGVGAGSADAGQRADNTMVISIPLTTSEALDGEASFVAWTNDGIAIDWADFPATALLGHVIFFYGDDLTAEVFEFSPSSNEDASVSETGLANKPDALIYVSGWLPHSDGNTSSASGRLSIGAATNYGGAIQQGCRMTFVSDTSFNTASVHRDNAIATRGTAGSEGAYLEIASFDDNGFTATTRGGSLPCVGAMLAMNLGGARAKVRTFVMDTNATGNKTIDGFGFKPEFGFFFGGEAITVNTYTTVQNNSGYIGAAVSASEAFTDAYTAQDAGDGGVSDSYSISTSSGPQAILNVASGVRYASALTNFYHDGLTLNVLLAGASDYVVSILCFEDFDARAPQETERISDSHVAFVSIQRTPVVETEAISDDFRLVVTSDLRVIGDGEQIADAVLLVRTSDRVTVADVEEISETFNTILRNTRVVDESVEIGDGFVMISSGSLVLVVDETESISDAFTTLLADASLVFICNESVEAGDGYVAISGTVLVTGDAVEITDAFNSGRGLIARKAIRRGRVF